MIINQDITTRLVTVTFTAPNYSLFVPVVIVQKIVENISTYVNGAILDTNIYTFTPTTEGLYKIRVLFFSTDTTYNYYIQGGNILYSTDGGITSISKTIQEIQNITEEQILEGTIQESYIVDYYGIYNKYITTTQYLLDEYIQNRDTYKLKYLQQLLDMGLVIIKYLIEQSLYIEANRTVLELLPYII